MERAAWRRPTRRFILVHPKLDYAALTPGEDASSAIRQTARGLDLDAAHGVTVRLTGSTPLSDEEFASLEDKAWLVGGDHAGRRAPHAVAGDALGEAGDRHPGLDHRRDW